MGVADGFGEVVVHAGLEAAFAVAFHGEGGEGDDGGAGAAGGLFALAEPAGDLETVELGHHDVHEDDVEAAGLEEVEGFEAVLGDGDEVSLAFEEEADDLAVDVVVLDEEDGEGAWGGGGRGGGVWGGCGGFGVGDVEGDAEEEGGPFVFLGLDPEGGGHHVGEAFGDGEAEAGAAAFAAEFLVAGEGVEDGVEA